MKSNNPKITLNKEALDELKSSINENVVNLSSEVHGYYAIRRYLESYRRKNQEHLTVIEENITKVQEELNGLDPNNEKEYDRYRYI